MKGQDKLCMSEASLVSDQLMSPLMKQISYKFPQNLSFFPENGKVLKNQIDLCTVSSCLSATTAMSVTAW